ncbi:MAG: hypothetical protein BWY99_01693 [Synergistetes bacterium ADurb.BinA166]|nr:MAG: hypothetical protein BWY99_01693 [Synergistetes bacterium ADurb.BinA166]
MLPSSPSIGSAELSVTSALAARPSETGTIIGSYPSASALNVTALLVMIMGLSGLLARFSLPTLRPSKAAAPAPSVTASPMNPSGHASARTRRAPATASPPLPRTVTDRRASSETGERCHSMSGMSGVTVISKRPGSQPGWTMSTV